MGRHIVKEYQPMFLRKKKHSPKEEMITTRVEAEADRWYSTSDKRLKIPEHEILRIWVTLLNEAEYELHAQYLGDENGWDLPLGLKMNIKTIVAWQRITPPQNLTTPIDSETPPQIIQLKQTKDANKKGKKSVEKPPENGTEYDMVEMTLENKSEQAKSKIATSNNNGQEDKTVLEGKAQESKLETTQTPTPKNKPENPQTPAYEDKPKNLQALAYEDKPMETITAELNKFVTFPSITLEYPLSTAYRIKVYKETGTIISAESEIITIDSNEISKLSPECRESLLWIWAELGDQVIQLGEQRDIISKETIEKVFLLIGNQIKEAKTRDITYIYNWLKNWNYTENKNNIFLYISQIREFEKIAKDYGNLIVQKLLQERKAELEQDYIAIRKHWIDRHGSPYLKYLQENNYALEKAYVMERINLEFKGFKLVTDEWQYRRKEQPEPTEVEIAYQFPHSTVIEVLLKSPINENEITTEPHILVAGFLGQYKIAISVAQAIEFIKNRQSSKNEPKEFNAPQQLHQAMEQKLQNLASVQQNEQEIEQAREQMAQQPPEPEVKQSSNRNQREQITKPDPQIQQPVQTKTGILSTHEQNEQLAELDQTPRKTVTAEETKKTNPAEQNQAILRNEDTKMQIDRPILLEPKLEQETKSPDKTIILNQDSNGHQPENGYVTSFLNYIRPKKIEES